MTLRFHCFLKISQKLVCCISIDTQKEDDYWVLVGKNQITVPEWMKANAKATIVEVALDEDDDDNIKRKVLYLRKLVPGMPLRFADGELVTRRKVYCRRVASRHVYFNRDAIAKFKGKRKR